MEPGSDVDRKQGRKTVPLTDREKCIIDLSLLNEKFEDYKVENDQAHKDIIARSESMGLKIDHLSGGVSLLTGRIDSFLLAQATNYTNVIDGMCKHVDEKLFKEMGATKGDIARSDEKIRIMQNIIFGADKDGGLVAKAEGLQKAFDRSILGLWTVNGVLFTFILAMIGYLIYLRI